MANKYLLPIFDEIYVEKFSYSNFNQRMEMQKAIYLLQEMGVPVGDYGFRWYLHGPYSQSLLDDMHYEDGRSYTKPTIIKEYADSIEQLHKLIISNKRGEYSVSNWAECLASLRYLSKNILSFNASDEDVVCELEKRKPHLDDHNTNMIACQLIDGLFS